MLQTASLCRLNTFQSDSRNLRAVHEGGSSSRHHGSWRQFPAARASAPSGTPAVEQNHSQQYRVLRVLAATDLHVDYRENMEWCRHLDGQAHRQDVLVVSGDVSDDLAALEQALACLAAKFAAVFYVPGNHELWVREADRAQGVTDSLAKLQRVLGVCRRLGVHTQPRRVGNLWLAPLFSWHHRSFDREPDVPGVPPVSPWTVADYSACKWPSSVPGGGSPGSLELAQWFDGLNSTPAWRQLLASRHDCDVIALAHFLPHQALLPEKRYLFWPNLAKAVGSAPLSARLAALSPDLCLVGHTHFSWDATIDGVRYIQAPLCSPLERQRRLMTVGFGVSMAAAQADPVAARWLPLVVYQGLVPAEDVERLRSSGSSAAQGPAVQQKQLQQQQQRQQPSREAAPQQLRPTQQQQQEDVEPQSVRPAATHHNAAPPQGLPAGEPPSAAHPRFGSWVAQGWQPLRHGTMVPPLHAHWSDHYASTARTPDNVVLAPWVARRYERRRARAASAGGGGGGSSSSSGSSSGKAEPGGDP